MHHAAQFFPPYLLRKIDSVEESMADLKEDDGETDRPHLQRLLVDVMLATVCDELARDKAQEAHWAKS